LFDIFKAVGEQDLDLFSVNNPFSEWRERCHVHDTLISPSKSA
jgi:hypothetical protein